MTGAVEICGLALARVGVEPIVAMDEPSAAGRACARVYDICRQVVLRSHPWGFAGRRVPLAQAAETTPGWRFVYLHPADCLLVRRVGLADRQDVAADLRSAWELGVSVNGHARTIVSNCPGAVIDYTADVTQAGLFDPAFIDCLAWRIAQDIAIPLSGRDNAWKIAKASYDEALASARAQDAQEAHAPPTPDAPWITGRW